MRQRCVSESLETEVSEPEAPSDEDEAVSV